MLRRRIQEIAKKLKVSDEAIQKALEEIASMDPSPGKRFSADTNNVIEPDIKIYLEDDIWKIELNNEYIPKLRISQKYKDLLAQGNLAKRKRIFSRKYALWKISDQFIRPKAKYTQKNISENYRTTAKIFR